MAKKEAAKEAGAAPKKADQAKEDKKPAAAVMHDDDSENEGPVSSFQSYAAEGDILAKQGDFRKSIEAYTKALTLRPGEKNCLVCRSKCHLQLGNPQAALDDANSSLKGDPEFFKGIFQKAEALYAKGDFEMALVYYHRGNKLRPELNEFRLGIQKAREAIDNAIGNPKDYKFQAPATLKNLLVPASNAPAGATGARSAHKTGESSGHQTGAVTILPPAEGFSSSKKDPYKNDKTVKQLLGELYADKLYLEQLLNDKDFVNNPNDEISALVSEALRYLEIRTEFWRQQKPIYARRKEHSPVQAKAIASRYKKLLNSKAKEFKERSDLKSREESQHRQALMSEQKTFEAGIRNAYKAIERGNLDNAKRAAESLLDKLGEVLNIKRKNIYSGECYSLMGNVYFGMQNYSLAIQYHKKDLHLGQEIHEQPFIKRAYANLGRCYVKMGKFKEAAHMFQERLKLVESETKNEANVVQQLHEFAEKAWLLHDLSRCYLELNNTQAAMEYAEQSVTAADQSRDKRWCLNTRVLMGQIQASSEQYSQATACYQLALSHARELEDSTAENVITLALKEIASKTGSTTAKSYTPKSNKDSLPAIQQPATKRPASSGSVLPSSASGQQLPKNMVKA